MITNVGLQPKIHTLMLYGLFFLIVSCSKGKFLTPQHNLEDREKKKNPYAGADTESDPSEISGAWLVMCRSTPNLEESSLLQCRVQDESDVKYAGHFDAKIELPDGSALDPQWIRYLPVEDYFSFEATVKSLGPVTLDVQSGDGSIKVQKKVPLIKTEDLTGSLVGIFCYKGSNDQPVKDSPCDGFASPVFVKTNGSACPEGYNWKTISSRLPGLGETQKFWFGSCVLNQAYNLTLFQDMKASPADYAVKGAAYGFSGTFGDTCDSDTTMDPMSKDCQCPSGFFSQQISSSNIQNFFKKSTYRIHTCIAKATGPKASALQKNAVTGIENNDSTPSIPCKFGNSTAIIVDGSSVNPSIRVCLSK